MNVFLIEPSKEYKDNFISMVKDYENSNDEYYLNIYKEAVLDFDKYVEKLLNNANSLELPEGWVPSSTYWLVNEYHEILGVIRIRHNINAKHLSEFVGHIGYDVCPSNRRKGYGQLILKLGIEKSRDLGISQLLITCQSDNIGSRRVIEKNMGVFESKVMDSNNTEYLRYWINI